MESQTTMKTNTGTLDRLREHGKCGDSLDNVLNKLLDKIDEVADRVDDLEDDTDEE